DGRIVQRLKGDRCSEHSPAFGRNISDDDISGNTLLRRDPRVLSDSLSKACDQFFPSVSAQSASNDIDLQSNDLRTAWFSAMEYLIGVVFSSINPNIASDIGRVEQIFTLPSNGGNFPG